MPVGVDRDNRMPLASDVHEKIETGFCSRLRYTVSRHLLHLLANESDSRPINGFDFRLRDRCIESYHSLYQHESFPSLVSLFT